MHIPRKPEQQIEVDWAGNNTTIDKLIEMRLTSMEDAFRIQMNAPNMKGVSFED